MTVRVIFVDTTLPARIRPRMETLPVKGHFLSVYAHVVVRGVSGNTHTNVGTVNRV